jgi:hypothetical protein
MNRLMIEMLSSMIQSLQNEAGLRADAAREAISGSSDNYTANMTAALVLQGLARAHTAMLKEIERSLK